MGISKQCFNFAVSIRKVIAANQTVLAANITNKRLADNRVTTKIETVMEIISYKRGGNAGALFIHREKQYSACTATESSKKFKTLKGAIAWLNKRGYKEA